MQFDKYVALDILNRVHISIEHIEVTKGELLTTHPEIDWKNVKGLRDIIAHHYFEVDDDQIWWIIENELQPLKKAIQEMIESLKRILDE